MAWTDDRVELLKKLWSDGLSASQIANQMGGVTRNAVIGKVHRLGLSGRVTSTRGRANSKVGKTTAAAKQRTQRREPKMPTMGNTALKSAPETKSIPVAEAKVSPVKLVETVTGDNISIFDLTEYTCRWPVGDPSTNDFHFCGSRNDGSGPYCESHAEVAYQPTLKRKVKKQA